MKSLRIPRDALERLTSAVSLPDHFRPYLDLKRSGDHYLGKCPFHEDSTPSFHVYEHHFHCFGCGKHGNVIDYEIFRTGGRFAETVRQLAEKYQVPLPSDLSSDKEQEEVRQRREMLWLMEECAGIFYTSLVSNSVPSALTYLQSRSIGKNEIQRWKLGFAPDNNPICRTAASQGWNFSTLAKIGIVRERGPDQRRYDFFRNRIIIPIRDETGKIVAFGGRISSPYTIEGAPKYLNSPETPLFSKSRVLFNLDRARGEIMRAREVVVVEGYMDCMALANAGFENVVAVLGTSLTPEHVKKLARFADRVIICFDSDRAGKEAALRTFEVAFPLNLVELLHCSVPEGKDPDEFVANRGIDEFRGVLQKAVPLIEHVCNWIGDSAPSPEARLRLIKKRVVPYVARNPDPAQREFAFARIARYLGLSSPLLLQADESTVLTALPKEPEVPHNVSSPSDRLMWFAASHLEIQLILGLIITTTTEHPSNLESLFDELSTNSREMAVEVRRVSAGSSARCLVEDCLSQEETSESIKALVGLMRKDLALLGEIGIFDWPFSEIRKSHSFVAGNVFAGANIPFLNFWLQDAVLSWKSGNAISYLSRIVSELERKAAWSRMWNRIRT